MTKENEHSTIIEIRKYPNRRYYDTTLSRHLTLEGIRKMIREGANVRIVDSQSGADITTIVLTQLILEFDASKLDLLTVPLLTEMIRVNDQVMKGFFEKFFHQALASFFIFQRQFEKQLREGTVLPSLFPALVPWLTTGSSDLVRTAAEETSANAAPKVEGTALAETVQQLQKQVTAGQRMSNRSRRRKTR
jgi:polyhydroxyalkanoate synthesis repressor PhaR